MTTDARSTPARDYESRCRSLANEAIEDPVRILERSYQLAVGKSGGRPGWPWTCYPTSPAVFAELVKASGVSRRDCLEILSTERQDFITWDADGQPGKHINLSEQERWLARRKIHNFLKDLGENSLRPLVYCVSHGVESSAPRPWEVGGDLLNCVSHVLGYLGARKSEFLYAASPITYAPLAYCAFYCPTVLIGDDFVSCCAVATEDEDDLRATELARIYQCIGWLRLQLPVIAPEVPLNNPICEFTRQPSIRTLGEAQAWMTSKRLPTRCACATAPSTPVQPLSAQAHKGSVLQNVLVAIEQGEPICARGFAKKFPGVRSLAKLKTKVRSYKDSNFVDSALGLLNKIPPVLP